MNSFNSQGTVAPRVGRLPYIYYSSAQKSNFGYPTLITVFSFQTVLGMPNKATA
jgi:hypothetical protein